MNTKREDPKSQTAIKEEEILAFWNLHNIFKKSLDKESPKGEFVFYDGPPFATGKPHYGHMLAGTIKDIIPRYKTMQGYKVARKWGWDCHGLPIENLIEKELGLKSKQDIEEYGIAKFNQAARDSVLRYEKEWKEYVPRSGRFIDMDNPYMSMQPSYMESVWWVFSELHKKNLTQQGFKAMHLCPRCETTLANFEVNLGYKDVTDISITAKFELVKEHGTFLLAWTTTPWTLAGNVALAVGSKISYSRIIFEDSCYIVAKELVDSVFDGKEYKHESDIKGSDLVGSEYVPCFDYYKNQEVENGENGWHVCDAEFVTVLDGTGIVHIAPSFGSDDMDLGKKLNLPFIQHVGRDGAFLDDFASTVDSNSFKGMKVKSKDDTMTTDIEIIKWLAHNGMLFSKKKLVHSYPHCWRCDTPLLNYATTSWFVDVPSIREKLIANNKSVNWIPEHIGEGRFGKWLEGARHWAISRSRFWGTPLPVWNSPDGSETMVVSSIKELTENVKCSGNNYYGIRHGESVSNTTGIVNAKEIVGNPLTEKGKQQAKAEAALIKEKNIDLVFVSPFQRTLETIEAIREKVSFKEEQIIIDERLKERNPGSKWEGGLWSVLHKEEESQTEANFWHYKLEHDAESVSEVYQRAMDFLFECEQKYTNKNILIVSHAGILKSLKYGLGQFNGETSALKVYTNTPNDSNAKLFKLDFKPFPHNENYEVDLHRPYIDDVVLISKKGTELKVLGEVFDVWFDSGSMPYAQAHYPFQNGEDFTNNRFPAQFIAEGQDQTRGWFYSLAVLGTALFDKFPYQNVIVNGLVLAEDGKKMSKSLNNYPEMNTMLNSFGADALRLFLIASPLLHAEEHPFVEKKVQETSSKVLGRTRNVMVLYETYKDDTKHSSSFDSHHVLDLWIHARTRELLNEVETNIESYQLQHASRPIIDYVDDLSTWYIRRSRQRFKSNDTEDKNRALSTTRKVLQVFSQIIAPFIPFIAEEIWQKLRVDDISLEESVHLSAWPEINPYHNDEEVLLHMKKVRDIVTTGLQLRSDANIKVRQVLSSLSIDISDIPKDYHSIICEELNVQKLVDSKETSLDTVITPELQSMGDVRELIRGVQSLRKDSAMESQDRAVLYIDTNNEGEKLISNFEEEIKDTAGITKIVFEKKEGEELMINNVSFTVSLER